MDAIIAYDLSKQYGSDIALCGVNLEIPQGSIFACVGEEKSGKTTLMRLLAGLCVPTMGECTVMGYSPVAEAEKVHAVTGVVLDTASLYEDMTLNANLMFTASINGIEPNDAIDRTSFLLHKLDIWEFREEPVRELPTGALWRASLARALMHSPRLLLIDEPAGGVDQESMDAVGQLIRYLVDEEEATVVLSTGNLQHAQTLCGSFAVLKEGSILAKGDLESLRKGAGLNYQASLRLGEGGEALGGFRLAADGRWVKTIASEEEMPKIIREAAQQASLYEAAVLKPTLEDIYDAYMNGVTGEEEAEQDGEEESEPGFVPEDTDDETPGEAEV